MDAKVAGEKRLLQLNELEEFCLHAYENAKIYKEQTKRWHEKHILRRDLQLKSRWLGPFEVVQVCPYRVVEVKKDDKNFKVNGQRLKVYIEKEFEKVKMAWLLD
ncbi:hypothetical protein P3X46_033531 [Hevea brasiliensis]|uniref:Uncharacterized protein n=1 Tax=Hevea brasiliensis TaxID=3981 RepID=A0ABQ9KBK0_HEVBR|nr:hypothetical protein P3X46_033531 [Hevea brasiliensis]